MIVVHAYAWHFIEEKLAPHVELLLDCLLKPPSYETVSSVISRLSSQTTVFDQLTLQWVVETGRPMLEATTTVKAEASSMLKPLQEEKEKKLMWMCLSSSNVRSSNVWGGCGSGWKQLMNCLSLYLEGVMGVRSFPIVWITRRPHTQSPAQIPTPPYSSNQMGVCAFENTLLVS